MRALRIHGPCIAKVDDIPVTPPNNHEVLVKVMAAGICGSDIELYNNDNPHIKDGRTKLPMVIGHEWAGKIVELGSGVTGFQIGDSVTGECAIHCGHCEYCLSGHYNLCTNLCEPGIFKRDGGFAEYITFPADSLHKFKNLSFVEAAMIEPLTVSFYAATRAKVHPTDYVLVTGAGPIGLQTAQILKKVFNVKKVLLSDIRESRLTIGLSLGADAVINVSKENLYDRICELTEGHMLDRVIETSGAAVVFNQLKGTIKPRGRIVTVGIFGSQKVNIDLDELVLNELTIVGANGSPSNWDDVIQIAESGVIQLKPLVSHVLSMEEFTKGIQLIVEKKENTCKVILKP